MHLNIKRQFKLKAWLSGEEEKCMGQRNVPRQEVHFFLDLLQLLPKLFHANHVQEAKQYDLQHP